MSGSDVEEPMDFQDQATSRSGVSPAEEVLLTLSLKWVNSSRPPNLERSVELCLQSWFNRCHIVTDCSVEKSGNDWVVIKLSHAPGVAQLQKLCGHTLKIKKTEAAATVAGISLTPPALGEEGASASSSGTQLRSEEPPGAEGRPGAAADPAPPPKENEPFVIVTVSQYWYLTQVHMDEITRITERNGVEMVENMRVSFRAASGGGSPQDALSEFTSFVQSHQTYPSVVPLKFVDPDKWSEVLQFARHKDKNVLLNLTSDNVVVFGPTASCAAVGQLLNAEPEAPAPASISEYKGATRDESPTIAVTISDPFVAAGVTMEESAWKLMKTSFAEKITRKFNVRLKEVRADAGKVRVTASSNRAGGNVSMESHASRALLRLYQKVATCPVNFERSLMKNGSGGDDDWESIWEECKAPGGAEAAAGSEGAAGAAGAQEDECPICADVFVDKTVLRCKHEMCKKCMLHTQESMGPVCPVCRDVYGRMEGVQPPGTMTSSTIYTALPGFAGCNTLEIVYDIPGGIQTSKHPNPGQPYQGVTRHAYLPDNREGREVLRLLRQAFDQKLIFTVGTSITTGKENSVTWNDIHHKTSTHGGAQRFGYPDPDYLTRVKEELKAKGIK